MVFIAPVLLPDYPAMLLSASRYLAFGLIAAALSLLDWRNLRQLSAADWWSALELSLIGNLLYYTCLAAAIQNTRSTGGQNPGRFFAEHRRHIG